MVGTCRGFLPPPEDVFDLRVEVRGGETTTRDLLLEEDRLGRVEGRIGGGLPQKGEASFVLDIDGVPCSGMSFERQTWVEDGRFRVENLHAGTYEVYFRDHRGLRPWTRVSVKRGVSAEALLEDRSGNVVIPHDAGEGLEALYATVKWRDLSQQGKEDSEHAWKSWQGPLEIHSSTITVRRVPEGLVRIGFRADRLPEVWTEELAVTRGGVTEASKIELRAAAPR